MRVRVRLLVLMVRVSGWGMYYVSENLHKHSCTNVCLCGEGD